MTLHSRSARQRVHTIRELADLCAAYRREGRTVALCHGAFDLLHPGHIRHLEAAKRLADVLCVTVTEDRFIRKGPGRPLFSQELRAESLAALRAVDHVAMSPWPTGVETIELIRPHFYVKGQDYREKTEGAILDEKRMTEQCGGRLVFTEEPRFSSTELIRTLVNAAQQTALPSPR